MLDFIDHRARPGHGLDAAGVFSAAGILAAGATAATGIADWSVSDDRDRRIGLFHGVLNTAALGLQGGSLAARLAGWRRDRARPRRGEPGGHRRRRLPRRSSGVRRGR